jgi:endonuclease YncB( thermonuclease family)
MNTARAAFFALSLLVALPTLAETGRVVRIYDGDTVDVLIDQTPVRVRLADIDAPERGQPYNRRARQALSALVFKRDVEVRQNGKDRYGRTLAHLLVDDMDVSAEMVRLGFAWVYRRYTQDAALLALEAEARAEQRGLWAERTPTPPWEYRAAKRAANGR